MIICISGGKNARLLPVRNQRCLAGRCALNIGNFSVYKPRFTPTFPSFSFELSVKTMFDHWRAGVNHQEPLVVLDLCDILVLAKPPGWEVYDRNAERQLAEFLVNLESAAACHWGQCQGKIPIVMWVERCHKPPIFLGMVNIPTIELVMTGGWCKWHCYLPTLYHRFPMVNGLT